MIRRRKAAAVFPRPLDKLYPVVRCCQAKYNMKLRNGKGFSVEEVKAASLKVQYARSIGVAVDLRRKNRNEEEFQRNVEILKDYVKRLVILPKDPKKQINGMTLKQLVEKAPQMSSNKAVEQVKPAVTFVEVTEKTISTKLPTTRILNERKKANKESFKIQNAKRLALKQKKKGKKGKKKAKGKKK
jgi:large subunit ribosomal protein L13e